MKTNTYQTTTIIDDKERNQYFMNYVQQNANAKVIAISIALFSILPFLYNILYFMDWVDTKWAFRLANLQILGTALWIIAIYKYNLVQYDFVKLFRNYIVIENTTVFLMGITGIRHTWFGVHYFYNALVVWIIALVISVLYTYGSKLFFHRS